MAVSVYEALERIKLHTQKIGFEIVPLENSLKRICAQKIIATHSLPRFNNSAMDGYGVKLDDAMQTVQVISTVLAGDKHEPQITQGQCVKIMTGARVPSSVEAIIPQEDVKTVNNTSITLPNTIQAQSHVRFIGEDIQNGEIVANIGDEINFATITSLASQGITHVKIFKRPKVVVFASGEELKLHYENVKEYQIYNSNTPTLIARTQELGCDTTFIGGAKDSLESIQEYINNALDADLIITSGGVSVGEADFTKEAFGNMGMEILFDGIIIKPGKPTVFGKINSTYVLNLPGNPLASALIFELFGKIIIQHLSGSKDLHHNTIHAKLNDNFNNKKGRLTLIPGTYDGEYFTPSQKRSPGMVNILNHCNSLIVLNEQVAHLEKNAAVKVLPVNWKFLTSIEKGFETLC
ncbi:MAG: molybdopterin molybdotransferase MoeA [Campylobacterota bacterium]|nr:molybdopterin molybdotransferase MoeA [Campylobacterota bacterium]